jgi:anti-anti-sigma factor
MEQSLLRFEIRGRIKVGTISSPEVLSATNVMDFGKLILNFIQRHPGLNLLLNFEHVDYLSSAVLTELLRIHKAVGDKGGHLRLCSISETIREVFSITNLDRMFIIDQVSLEESLKRFNRSLDVEDEEAAWEEPSGS